MGQDAIEAFGEVVNTIDRPPCLRRSRLRRESSAHAINDFCGRVHGRQVGGIPPRGQHCAAQHVESAARSWPRSGPPVHRDGATTRRHRSTRPRRCARSLMLRATTTRCSRARICATSTRLRVRLHASTTTTIASCAGAPASVRPGDGALRCVQVQVVDAGKIENLDRPRQLGPLAPSRSNGGRGPGEIRRLRARPAQGVEQRGLAGIGIAGQHDPMDVGCDVLICRGEDGR